MEPRPADYGRDSLVFSPVKECNASRRGPAFSSHLLPTNENREDTFFSWVCGDANVTRVLGREKTDGVLFRKGCKQDSVLNRTLKLLVFVRMAVGMVWAAGNPFICEWKL